MESPLATLETRLHCHAEYDVDKVKKELLRPSSKEIVVFLQSLATDRKRYTDFFVRCHPLGFFVINPNPPSPKRNIPNSLSGIRSNSLSGIRLNLYSKYYFSYETDEIHSHAFDFLSRIMLGSICQERFVQGKEGTPYDQYISDGRIRTYLGSALLKRLPPQEYTRGTIYSVSMDTIHTVKPISDIAVSLLARSRYRQQPFEFYSKPRMPTDSNSQRVPFEQFRDFVEDCRNFGLQEHST